MPKLYCDYCGMYVTHDSPSVRKTHCSGWKHRVHVRDYYQQWMNEQAQSLTDKTRLHSNKIAPAPFSAPPPAGAMIPPPQSLLGPLCPGMIPALHIGGPPMMPMMAPPLGMMPIGPAPGIRPPLMSLPTRTISLPTHPDMSAEPECF